MNEKSFEIGQKVRIIGPTARGNKASIGKCFMVEEINDPTWRYYGYSRRGCPNIFPASSLELVEPEYDCPQGIRCPYIPKSYRLEMVEQRCMAIEKRLQALEGKANNEVATDTSDELHVGDYVEVVGQPLDIFGHPTGMTDRVWRLLYPAGLIALESSGLWYSRRSLRKLSDDEIIAKIGRERKA